MEVQEPNPLKGHEAYLWPFLTLFALDGALTALGTWQGWVKEVNPILDAVSPGGILALKVTFLVPLWFLGRWLWQSNPKLAKLSLLSLTLTMGVVASWVLTVILHELAWLKWGTKILG